MPIVLSKHFNHPHPYIEIATTISDTKTNIIIYHAFHSYTVRRQKVVHNGEEEQKFKQLSLEHMSEESDPDDTTGSMAVHQPVWRSKGLFTLQFLTSFNPD